MGVCTYTHGKGTTEVIENDPRTGIAGVIHFRLWYGDKDGIGDTKGQIEMGVDVMLDGCETESDDDALHLFSKPCATTEKPRQARWSRLPSPSTTIHNHHHHKPNDTFPSCAMSVYDVRVILDALVACLHYQIESLVTTEYALMIQSRACGKWLASSVLPR
jgi:hypothetical protein